MKTIAGLLLLSLTPAAVHAQGLAVWDTGKSSAEPLAPSILKKEEGWTRISRGGAGSFKGDAVLSNGRITAVIRKKGDGVELYTASASGPVSRAVLRLLDAKGRAAVALKTLKIIDHNRGAVRVSAAYRTSRGGTVAASFRIKRGDVTVEAAPGAGADRLRLECPSRYVVLPDFFADDIVIDAGTLPLSRVGIPSENFLIHLTGNGDCFAMAVFENPEQEVELTLAGTGEAKVVTGSEIRFGKDRKIWVALMEAPQIWHAVDVREEDARKIVPLKWKMPFPAQWRIDFTTTRDLVDSWEMLLQKKRGESFLKPTWMGRGAGRIAVNRKRWTTVLGTFLYPCWTDPEGRGYIQPLKHRKLAFRGPAVIYPINRMENTPADVYSVIDIVRNSLGVGPCEYILDMGGQKKEKRGKATCATRDFLQGIYKNGEQKRKRAQVNERLDQVLVFVKHIRSRIEIYRGFGNEIRPYLAARKKARPELKKPIEELEALAGEIERRVERRREKIKTPDHVARMNEDFRKNLLDYAGKDAFDKVKAYTKALVTIGDNQDELSAECRWAVKTLRQRAGMMMALDPRMTVIAAEIRNRAQKVLRNPAHHEGPRH